MSAWTLPAPSCLTRLHYEDLFELVLCNGFNGLEAREGNAMRSAKSGNAKAAFASPGPLTATLTNGNSIILHWKNNATAVGGVWVEYTQPDYTWIKLDAFPSDEHMTSFVHPDLAPQTVYIYRILPFFGQPTRPVEIATGIASTNLTGLVSGPIDSTNGIPSGERMPKYSIRKMPTFALATPTDLTASLSSQASKYSFPAI